MKDTSVICIIEDEIELADLLSDYLKASHFQTRIFHDGESADAWLQHNNVNLILMDLMLPGIDGLQLCKRQLARATTPIIMMTAKVEEVDRLLGLELGADDYICKPFSPREVVARVKAVLRRMQSESVKVQSGIALAIHESSLSVSILGKTVSLTHIEFQLFALLHSQPGRIFSRQYILDNIYRDYRVVSDRTVDSHIKKLRKKIALEDNSLELIHSVYGSGYKFEVL